MDNFQMITIERIIEKGKISSSNLLYVQCPHSQRLGEFNPAEFQIIDEQGPIF
jgi:hypothetical protein